MSRHLQDPKPYYETINLPDPQTLNSRNVPMDSYHRDRYRPEHQMPTGRHFPTDPAGYNYSTANSSGWRGQRTFEELLPYEGEDRPDYIDSPTLPPMRNLHPAQGSRGSTTSLGDRDTGRSVQNTRHLSRTEERHSEYRAPTAHEPWNTRRSEGRGSGNSGEGGKNRARNKDPGDLFADPSFHKGTFRTYAFHSSTFNTTEQNPLKFQQYSEQDQEAIINYVKARDSWRQIGQKLLRDERSVSRHWNQVLKKDPRAYGVRYNPM